MLLDAFTMMTTSLLWDSFAREVKVSKFQVDCIRSFFLFCHRHYNGKWNNLIWSRWNFMYQCNTHRVSMDGEKEQNDCLQRKGKEYEKEISPDAHHNYKPLAEREGEGGGWTGRTLNGIEVNQLSNYSRPDKCAVECSCCRSERILSTHATVAPFSSWPSAAYNKQPSRSAVSHCLTYSLDVLDDGQLHVSTSCTSTATKSLRPEYI